MSVPRLAPLAAVLLLTGCGGLGAGQAPPVEVGECLDYESISQPEVLDIPVKECTEEHDAQVVGTFVAGDGDFPTEGEWTELITERCLPAFEDFVGTGYADSELEITYLNPDEQGWRAGDREVICVAYLADGTTTKIFQDSGL